MSGLAKRLPPSPPVSAAAFAAASSASTHGSSSCPPHQIVGAGESPLEHDVAPPTATFIWGSGERFVVKKHEPTHLRLGPCPERRDVYLQRVPRLTRFHPPSPRSSGLHPVQSVRTLQKLYLNVYRNRSLAAGKAMLAFLHSTRNTLGIALYAKAQVPPYSGAHFYHVWDEATLFVATWVAAGAPTTGWQYTAMMEFLNDLHYAAPAAVFRLLNFVEQVCSGALPQPLYKYLAKFFSSHLVYELLALQAGDPPRTGATFKQDWRITAALVKVWVEVGCPMPSETTDAVAGAASSAGQSQQDGGLSAYQAVCGRLKNLAGYFKHLNLSQLEVLDETDDRESDYVFVTTSGEELDTIHQATAAVDRLYDGTYASLASWGTRPTAPSIQIPSTFMDDLEATKPELAASIRANPRVQVVAAE